jgi:hypothetical protein
VSALNYLSLLSFSSVPPITAPVSDVLTEEKDMEAEFASWQAKLGPDFSALESALKPVERYSPIY